MPNDIILERLMNEYGTSILRTCFLYIGDYHLAQDATQETFLKAMNAYHNLKNKDSEKAWLTKIAINCCKNIMRSNWYKSVTIDNELLGLRGTDNPINNLIEHNTLAEAVMSLSKNDRKVIILYYYQGLTIKEISEFTHKKLNTVTQQIRRARRKLKEILEENIDETNKNQRKT